MHVKHGQSTKDIYGNWIDSTWHACVSSFASAGVTWFRTWRYWDALGFPASIPCLPKPSCVGRDTYSPHGRGTLAQATAIRQAPRRKEICWRSTEALQRYTESSTQQIPDWSEHVRGRTQLPTVQNGVVASQREPLIMKKIVWPELRIRDEYARHSLSAAHQHKVTFAPSVESHFELPSDCSATVQPFLACVLMIDSVMPFRSGSAHGGH